MVAVSPQKLTCDRTCTVLDVWKVGAALELFGTSWAVGVGEMRSREVVWFWRVAYLDEILKPESPTC